jgi:alkaline phosphatase
VRILSTRLRIVALVVLVVVAGVVAYGLLRPRNLSTDGQLDVPGLPGAPDGSEVLLAVGDIGSCEGGADDAVAGLAAELPGEIAILGDIAYPDGTAADFARCFAPAWEPLRDRLRPVPGNHEYHTGDASAYFDWFGAAAGTRGEGWYSYELGDWHVVALNSNCAEVGCETDSPQLDWLRQDLADHRADDPADCLLAYWHHPRWSSGRHGSIAVTDPLWQALREAGVDVVLGGHEHSYERLRVDGVRSFVVGTGGRSLYAFTRDELAGTEARHQGSHGLLWLALGDGSYEWEFLPLGATTFTDAGQGECSS